MIDMREFDRWAEEHGYSTEESPQAFADYLASKTGDRVVGISEDGAVEGKPS